MNMEGYETKPSVVLVYTGDGKGKTSASLGLMARALGGGWKVAYLQFIKHWRVGEHEFIEKIQPLYSDQLYFYRGGKGFYNAGTMSAKHVSEHEHKVAAEDTYAIAQTLASSGEYQLVICDEINNAVHDGLLTKKQLSSLITTKHATTSLCLTGRNFPSSLLSKVDIATDMHKIKHHYDDKFLANPGIDY